MSIVLRILAGLVMALGIVTLVVIAVLFLEQQATWRSYFFKGTMTESAMLAGIAITLAGALWALTRIAEGQPARAIPDAERLADPRPPQVRLYGTGSLLRVLGMVQIGTGLIAFVALCCMVLSEAPRKEWHVVGSWLMIVATLSLGYACLGGILFALTRIAYPPTPRR